MADASRTLVNKLVLHHAVTARWQNKSKAELAQWFSDLGFSRGYGSNPANWNGNINPYNGQRSYAMAHFAGQLVDGSTPDASAEERAAGFRLVPLIQDVWGRIAYHAGNWPVNTGSIGIEILGDFRNYPLEDAGAKVIAAFWRGRDVELKGATTIYGHSEVSQLGTACPCRVMESRDTIVNYVNNPPAAPQPPAPTPPAPIPVNNPYVRFQEPMNLIAAKTPTNAYDLSKTTWAELGAAVVKQLNQGDPFVAVGKYTHPLGGVYFMTQYSFGNADQDGTPDHPYGVNTVDLSPAPAAPAPAEPVPPAIPEPDPVPETPVVDTPPADDGSVEVPVKVVPADPNKWKESFTVAPNEFVARLDAVIHDLSGAMQDIQLKQGQTVHVAGKFVKDGVTYYRTKRSVEMGWWYGIPVKTSSIDTLLDTDDMFSLDDIDLPVNLSLKEKIIKFFASLFGWTSAIGEKKK